MDSTQNKHVTAGKKVELLLPVGTKEMALAAIHNGADAIFLGVPGFNARGRSHDFEIETLKEIIELCHLYQVKANLAFNILIFQEELESAAAVLEKILPLKPDAFIVQDLGLVQLIRKMAPQQRIHASTQMTVTNHEAIQLLEDMKIQRFVLGRENSLDDIKRIRGKTEKEIEVFVHGALCVSYSGQCFTSESIGGRSANRGQCAQSCRFSYEMYVDGEKREMGSKKYLVSPQDLCGLDEVPELVASGVDCFKIEGRLKSPEYVATSARAYRTALDQFQSGEKDADLLSKVKKDMAVSYSRGFFSGWFHGVSHQKLVNAQYSAHRGYRIGKILEASKSTMTVQLDDENVYQDLVAGDGLLWTHGSNEQGGFIYSIQKMPKLKVRIEFSRDLTLSSDVEGSSIYQNHDKELKKSIVQSVEDKNKKKRLDVTVVISIVEGQPLHAVMTDGQFTVQGNTTSVVVPAQSKGVSDESLAEEFSSLTGSIFKLKDIQVRRSTQANIFIPHKEFKNLRQQLVAELTEKRQGCGIVTDSNLLEVSGADLNDWMKSKQAAANVQAARPRLNVLFREKGQVKDLIDAVNEGKIKVADIDTVTLDFEFGRDYQGSVEDVRSLGLKVGLATTRILKPNEYRNLKVLADLNPDSILVRNLGALFYLTEERPGNFELRGDFSLNVTNHLTADYLLNKGLKSLCLSYDMNHHQVSRVLDRSMAANLEITIFQYMPSFHMEHCVFAAFLSQGSSYKDCGKPCEQHDIRLKDQFQNWHQIKPDQECRNTMYNAKSQSAGRYLQEWSGKGLGFVRYEALKERGDDLITKIAAHIDLVQGAINFEELVKQIGTVESYGISEGQYGKEKEYQSRKK